MSSRGKNMSILVHVVATLFTSSFYYVLLSLPGTFTFLISLIPGSFTILIFSRLTHLDEYVRRLNTDVTIDAELKDELIAETKYLILEVENETEIPLEVVGAYFDPRENNVIVFVDCRSGGKNITFSIKVTWKRDTWYRDFYYKDSYVNVVTSTDRSILETISLEYFGRDDKFPDLVFLESL